MDSYRSPYGAFRTQRKRGRISRVASGFVQIAVWRVPQPVPPSEHAFKYRLAYVVDGARVVGYDNERGKGDHKHLGNKEVSYRFVDIPTLLDDFWLDVIEASQ